MMPPYFLISDRARYQLSRVVFEWGAGVGVGGAIIQGVKENVFLKSEHMTLREAQEDGCL